MEGEPRQIEVRPGETVTLYEDEDISFLVWQGSPPDAHHMTNMVQTMISRAGLSEVFYGGSMSGDSGYKINQLLAAARVKFRPIVAHMERAMEQLMQLLWDIIEYQIKQELPVYAMNAQKWYSLSPEDLDGYRHVHVAISPLLPTDLYATSSRVINEVHAGLRDISSAMEEIGIGQPDEMKRAIRIDQIINSQPMQAILMEEAARRYGLKVEEAQPTVSGDNLLDQWGDLPPALQEAIAAYAMSQQGTSPDTNVMAAPGTMALPEQAMNQPQNQLARTIQPSGVAQGRPSGPRMTGRPM